MRKRKFLYRIISIGVALAFLFVMGMSAVAQDDAAEEPATEEVAAEEAAAEEVVPPTDVEIVQFNLDMTWMLTAGFLVFFMQAGFAMLEGGFIRHTGVVNSIAENFMDACITALVFFAVGFGIAYAGDVGGGVIPIPFSPGIATELTLTDAAFAEVLRGGLEPYSDFFFQFAFAGAAATIATGAMAERTDFRGKLIYSAILGAIIYPVVVFWSNWNGGFLGAQGMVDFAGSTIVHRTGGVIALVGAIMVGPRVGRVFGTPPRPSNMGLAAMGTFILWFGWYGFNVGSTLAASDVHLMGLVAVNTTLAAAAASLTAMLWGYFFKGQKWDLSLILNGSLAGLVGITAGCAFVSPTAAIIIGLTAGVVVVLSMDAVEAAKVDDAVGAFAVHGACGALGTLAIGFWGVPELLGAEAGGLFLGGGISLLVSQLVAVVVVAAWAAGAGIVMFGALKVVGLLRMPAEADEMGIDAYEHGASIYGDILPVPSPEPAGD